jgi:hypothetical protein
MRVPPKGVASRRLAPEAAVSLPSGFALPPLAAAGRDQRLARLLLSNTTASATKAAPAKPHVVPFHTSTLAASNRARLNPRAAVGAERAVRVAGVPGASPGAAADSSNNAEGVDIRFRAAAAAAALCERGTRTGGGCQRCDTPDTAVVSAAAANAVARSSGHGLEQWRQSGLSQGMRAARPC